MDPWGGQRAAHPTVVPRARSVVVVAAAVPATATATATKAARAVFHGARLVHDDAAAAERLAIHSVDCSLRLGVAAHLHEAETLGAAGLALHHDLGARDLAELVECLFQVAVTHLVG